MFTFKASLPA